MTATGADFRDVMAKVTGQRYFRTRDETDSNDAVSSVLPSRPL
jgi:hypothetical protein